MTTVLITNDDGVGAPGIRALAEAVRARGFEVVVAAPVAEASGMSAALTAVTDGGRLVLEPTPDGLGVPASPAYIVVLATLGVFGPVPDVVLAGINRGGNTGRAVLHSGTVGAALTAGSRGIRALAVSLDTLAVGSVATGGAALELTDDADLHWDVAAELAAGLLDDLLAAPAGTVRNLNVPDRATPPELRTAPLAESGQVRIAVAERGSEFVRLTWERTGEAGPGSDVALLAEGFATLTELHGITALPGTVVPAQRISG